MKFIYFVAFIAVLLTGGCDSGGMLECESSDCADQAGDGNDPAGDTPPEDSGGSETDSNSDVDNNGTDGSGSETGDSEDTNGAGTDGEEDNSNADNNNPGDGNNDSAAGEETGQPPGASEPDVSVASGLALNHRSGQTFITWDEPHSDAGYHVYRSTQPINTDNLDDATLLTWRWGHLDTDTSRNKYAVSDVPSYFVIEDLGAPLSDSTGLFVHTATENATSYYAVTTILDGVENRTIIAGQNSASVEESIATPQPVLTRSVNGGKGRLYTQYMDYQQWNPTLKGYVFNYYLALPFDYNPSLSYPLQVELHAYGYYPAMLEEVRYQWQVVQLIPLDPGDDLNTYHSWWYGYSRDHNYLTNGNTPYEGVVENFTQQRVMKSIQEAIDNPEININANLIHAYGNSMGASGSVSLAMHYPTIFAGIYASQPMMNYAGSTRFRYNFERLFGTVEANLPIVNGGLFSGSIQRYGQGGDQPTGVWDWMNHHAQVQRRRGDEFAFMMLDFGKADDVIDWQTQGRPTFSAFSNAKVAFTATAREGVGHEWRGFDSVNDNLFELPIGRWRYPNTLSYPALGFASGSGRIDPPSSGDDEYQMTLEWSTPHYGFGQSPLDERDRYEITLRSTDSEQRVDVTPRNTQAFQPATATQCNWLARNVNNNTSETGIVTVDSNSLVTVPQVNVTTDGGTRLIIDCS